MARNSDELADAITLLLGNRDEEFAHERELRMFQFQCWLLDAGAQDASFKESARIFAAALLSRKTSRTRARNRGMRTRDCFLVAVASNDMEGILNFCFRRRSLYSLLGIGNFLLIQSDHDEAVDEIVDLSNLVEAQVRLHLTSERASHNAGKKLLPKLSPESRRRTGIGKVHRKRAKREPFLFAAKCVAPEFLRMDFESTGGTDRLITPNGLLSQVTKKAEDRDAFRRLCGAAKATAQAIKFKWSAEVANALVFVEPQLPALERVPAKFLPKKIPRRPARETKKAVRQRVGK